MTCCACLHQPPPSLRLFMWLHSNSSGVFVERWLGWVFFFFCCKTMRSFSCISWQLSPPFNQRPHWPTLCGQRLTSVPHLWTRHVAIKILNQRWDFNGCHSVLTLRLEPGEVQRFKNAFSPEFLFFLFFSLSEHYSVAEGADIVSSPPEKNLPSLEYVVHVPTKLLRKCWFKAEKVTALLCMSVTKARLNLEHIPVVSSSNWCEI